jgi:hypothetical protein
MRKSLVGVILHWLKQGVILASDGIGFRLSSATWATCVTGRKGLALALQQALQALQIHH